LLGGHDVCVVMPTGGGKSLCYQLPAVMSAGNTVVVISPLIALMQDQVAQLEQMGIASAMLNSSLGAPEQARVMQQANGGRYRLLYLSPERLAREETIRWLQRVPVSFFVIDFPSLLSRPAPRAWCATTLSSSSICAIRTGILPVSTGPICATPFANATAARSAAFW
jgi:ATP-dependent DNA helicase RecQ